MKKFGQRLQDERLRLGLSVEEVSKKTKIRGLFIKAIEEGDYTKLPSGSYVQGFVRNYIDMLGLPTRQWLALFRREFDERAYLKILPESFTKRRDVPLYRWKINQTIVLTGIILFLLLGYLFFQYRAAFINPSVTIILPKEQTTIISQTVTVMGQTDASNTVSVNGIAVYVDNNGNFKKDIALFPGKQIVTIKVINSFGRVTIIQRHISVASSS